VLLEDNCSSLPNCTMRGEHEINEFKRGNQPRIYLVKAKNGHLLADSHKFSIGGRTISLSY
jgi:hypothetical protein